MMDYPKNEIDGNVEPHGFGHAAALAGHVAPALHRGQGRLVQPVIAAGLAQFGLLRGAVRANEDANHDLALLAQALAEWRVGGLGVLQVVGVAGRQVDPGRRRRRHRGGRLGHRRSDGGQGHRRGGGAGGGIGPRCGVGNGYRHRRRGQGRRGLVHLALLDGLGRLGGGGGSTLGTDGVMNSLRTCTGTMISTARRSSPVCSAHRAAMWNSITLPTMTALRRRRVLVQT